VSAGTVLGTSRLDAPVGQDDVVITNMINFSITYYTEASLAMHIIDLFCVHHAPFEPEGRRRVVYQDAQRLWRSRRK